MPVHDWTRVDAGIFHAFHHGWIGMISNALNEGLLPPDYYALPEQLAAGFGPDVLALQSPRGEEDGSDGDGTSTGGGSGLLVAKPAQRRRLKRTWNFIAANRTGSRFAM